MSIKTALCLVASLGIVAISTSCAINNIKNKVAYRGKMVVSQRVNVAALQGRENLNIEITTRNPVCEKFIKIIKDQLSGRVPASTQFKNIGNSKDVKTITLRIELLDYNAEENIKGGREGLTMNFDLVDTKNNSLGRAAVLATPQEGSTVLPVFTTNKLNPDHLNVAVHTAQYVGEFLKGKP